MRKERERGFGFGDDDQMDADEIEEYYRKRYNEDAAGISAFGEFFRCLFICFCASRPEYRPIFIGEGGEAMSDEITQQTLLPGVKDPNLWMVKCLPGTEKQTVLRIMNKFIAYQHTEEPLQIRHV